MANPQQPELGRSRKTPHQDQDSVEARVGAQRPLEADAPPDRVPVENRPGHHPADEQDKPDLDAFAERLGVVEPTDGDGAGTTGDATGRPTGGEGSDTTGDGGGRPTDGTDGTDGTVATTVATATRRAPPLVPALVTAALVLIALALSRRRRRSGAH